MSAEASLFFVDTSVLLYALDTAAPEKQRTARWWLDLLWGSAAGRLSWQVLNEFYVNAVKIGVPARAARRLTVDYSYWQPASFGTGLLRRAWHWMDRAGVPYGDSLIVAAAEVSGCAVLLSEDFQAGQRFDAVTAVNPFRSSPGEFGLGPPR